MWLSVLAARLVVRCARSRWLVWVLVSVGIVGFPLAAAGVAAAPYLGSPAASAVGSELTHLALLVLVIAVGVRAIRAAAPGR